MKVLFVCHGNVNRSAAAHIIAVQDYPDLEVKSCGLKATEGTLTTKKMRGILNENGYKTEGIRSTQINQELVDWADVIFYMDDANEKRFVNQFGNLSKAQKLSNFIPGVKKIPDPGFSSGTEDHQKAFDLVKAAIDKWITG